MTTNFDGWYVKTISDSAFFKTGLDASTGFLILNKDSMQSELYINPMGDYISLFESNGYMVEQIIFGGLEGSHVWGPREGQSICAQRGSMGEIIYYLDQSPTLGHTNDTLNANGTLEGYVSDSAGVPIEFAHIVYGHSFDIGFPYDLYVLSDSTGYFKFDYLGILAPLVIWIDLYEYQYKEVQIWPDSTCMIDTIKLKGPISNIEDENLLLPAFELLQNYPNPFNPTTKIKFTIPLNVISTEGRNLGDFSLSSSSRNDNRNVQLKVYDILGNEIAALVNELKPPGTYEVAFDGSGLSSGIYFYKLSVGKYSETRKMLLMK
jgi:hypothetical protein